MSPGTSELFLLKSALRPNRVVLMLILSIGLFEQDSISMLIDNGHLPNKHYENALGGLAKLRNRFKQILSQITCVCVCVLFYCVYTWVCCVPLVVVVSFNPHKQDLCLRNCAI